ncbi:MAG: ATP-binding protein [Psychroflexus sp.]|jgi:two-component system phosphate regulon sensor histidine kinase PhoR|nr:ATP-binding protein [Psychroflexus sp.]
MTDKKIKKTYKFAYKTSFLISFLFTVVLVVLLSLTKDITWWIITIGFVSSYIISFIVIQQRVEHFIYRRVKSIYDRVSLLDATTVSKENVTTDMTTLQEEVEKFAQNKKLEIETLKDRENYRKEFMGNVSHELKTPLFTVQGYILTLLDGALKDKKVRDKYLNRASKGVDRLIYIVRDLDMITKLESGDLTLYKEEFDLIEIVQNVFDLLEMKAAKKDITLTFDSFYPEPIWVFADKEKIQQLLTNLIVNSIKYGKKDGATVISLEELNKEKLLVKVSDNGIGIARENIKRLFERFYRVDKSGSRKEGGSGLGLSIVKHIIEAHKEKITVNSQLGEGSEFSFTLKKAENFTKIKPGESNVM